MRVNVKYNLVFFSLSHCSQCHGIACIHQYTHKYIAHSYVSTPSFKYVRETLELGIAKKKREKFMEHVKGHQGKEKNRVRIFGWIATTDVIVCMWVWLAVWAYIQVSFRYIAPALYIQQKQFIPTAGGISSQLTDEGGIDVVLERGGNFFWFGDVCGVGAVHHVCALNESYTHRCCAQLAIRRAHIA